MNCTGLYGLVTYALHLEYATYLDIEVYIKYVHTLAFMQKRVSKYFVSWWQSYGRVMIVRSVLGAYKHAECLSSFCVVI
jgi:hypothetical protein